MKTAISTMRNDLASIIPDRFESGCGLMIVETDTMEVLSYATNEFADVILANDCEMLLCGEISDSAFFDKIAEYGVSRYNASGLSGKEAIEKALQNQLPLLRDYVGGSGCHSHDSSDGACHHHHEEND